MTHVMSVANIKTLISHNFTYLETLNGTINVEKKRNVPLFPWSILGVGAVLAVEKPIFFPPLY